MKKILCVILLCAGVMGFIQPTIGYEDKMGSFKWLVGSWSMNSTNALIIETWVPMSDTSFEGESTKYNKKTTETVPLEKVRLVCRNKEYFYIPVARGQNKNQPIEFKITSVSKKGFAAENPSHDFPKRITYVLKGKDSLHAFIDGGPALPSKRSDYYYARVKRPPPPPPPKKN